MDLKRWFLDSIGYKPDPYEMETGKYPACWPDNHPPTVITGITSYPLPDGMKFEHTTPPVTFIDMGPDDVLVLHAPDTLGRDAYLRQKRNLRHALKRPGRVELVLDGGATVTVVRRKPLKDDPIRGHIGGTDHEPTGKLDPLISTLKEMKRELDGDDVAYVPQLVPVVSGPNGLMTIAGYPPLNRPKS